MKKTNKLIDVNSDEFKFAIKMVKEANIKDGKTEDEVKLAIQGFINDIEFYNRLSRSEKEKTKKKLKKDGIKSLEDILIADFVSRH